ncbi:sortase-dependent protein [Streptomyces sp. NPDC091281]|uniref:sortase-dependent protein n=1 Tax=Streptomyces sp. NPDC091281 TaxID=3365985 RepID=UPI0037FD7E6B
MRRTGLGALAVAGAALFLGAGSAAADGRAPSPVASAPAQAEGRTPTPVPYSSAQERSDDASAVPAPAEGFRDSGQVRVVPRGAAETGETTGSGHQGALIGGGAAAVLALGGAGIVVVRRRGTTGA